MSDFVFIDPSTARKNKIVQNKLRFIGNVPVFSIIELNIHGNCTRRCPFCPIALKEYKKTNDRLDVKVFDKMTRDLAAINYDGKILFSGFSEPLLHKELEELFRTAKRNLPNGIMEIVSNSDLFTEERVKGLFTAGLDTMSVSVYDGPEQMAALQKMVKDYGLTDKQVVLRRRYKENGNYGITVSNRTGLVDSNEYRDEHEEAITELPLKSQCFYPFYMTMVNWNGDMLLCPHDWHKVSKVGNVGESNIWELWQSKYLMATRNKLACGDRNFKPCNTCDVRGNVIGQENFDAWQPLLHPQSQSMANQVSST